jgi:hypothetical protein
MRSIAAVFVLSLFANTALADEAAKAEVSERSRGWSDAERRFVVGVGGAFELEMADRSFHAGGTAFFEVEVIERWLEIEAGVSIVRTGSGFEVPIDLLFKKPFRLTQGIELMVGVGPEVVRSFRAGSTARTFFGVEGALDFMFWPTDHFGFWAEPTYDLVFSDRATLSFGTTVGPIIGW